MAATLILSPSLLTAMVALAAQGGGHDAGFGLCGVLAALATLVPWLPEAGTAAGIVVSCGTSK
jgi:hypothetical protein